MRLLAITVLSLIFHLSVFYSAEARERLISLDKQGSLISIPDSEIQLELGEYTAKPRATVNNGTMTIKMATYKAQSGFVIKNLQFEKFIVKFIAQGKNESLPLDPNTITGLSYSYLPPLDTVSGGVFIVTLPGQTGGLQKKKKGFLN